MRNLFLLLLIGMSIGCNQQLLQEDRETAKEQIVNLKEGGALVVRLNTKNRKMTKLRENGLEAKAKAVGEDAVVMNKLLMAAFKAEFDFCPVYFINEKGTLSIREEGVKKNIFLNDDLEIDESIQSDAKYFLTVEYGQTVRSPDMNFDSKYMHKGNKGVEMRDRYKGAGSEVEVTGLVMKDEKFVQLRRPFPLYIREYTAVLSRNYNEMVRLLNKNLHTFYKQQK